MTVNDGKGLYDKYGMIDNITQRLELLADAKGVLRCGLIWEISRMLSSLKDGLQKEDSANTQKVEELKRMVEAGGVEHGSATI